MGGLVYMTNLGENAVMPYGYVNIHYHASAYKGGALPQLRGPQHFRDIQSRYLQAIGRQLARQQTTKKNREEINGLVDLVTSGNSEMERLEAAIERSLAENYNQAVQKVQKINSNLGEDYAKIVQNLRDAFEIAQKGKTSQTRNAGVQQGIAALDDLYNLVMSEPKIVSLMQTFRKDKQKEIQTNVRTLMELGRIEQKLQEISQGIGAKTKEGKWVRLAGIISNLLTPTSEFIGAFIETYAEGQLDKVMSPKELRGFFGKVGKSMVGTSGVYIKRVSSTATDIWNEPLRSFTQSKAVDVHGATSSLEYNFKADAQGGTITAQVKMAPAISIKAYSSDGNSFKVTETQSKSILLDIIKRIYGSEYDNYKYALFNTLAQQSTSFGRPIEGRELLDSNFRILRSDVTAEMAEQFIAGFQGQNSEGKDALTANLLVIGYRAYPILGIINAVIYDALTKTGPYGSTSSEEDLFAVQFTNVGSKNVC